MHMYMSMYMLYMDMLYMDMLYMDMLHVRVTTTLLSVAGHAITTGAALPHGLRDSRRYLLTVRQSKTNLL